MGISIGLAVLTIAAGLGSVAGSSSKVAQLAEKGNKLAKFGQAFASQGKGAALGAKIASKLPQSATSMAKMGGYFCQGLNGASTIMGGKATIEAAHIGAEATDLEMFTKELEAILAKLMAEEGDATDRIEEVLARLDELASVVLQILSGDAELFQKTQLI